MSTSERFWEMEFEMAVTSHLEDDCELRVHVAGDALNRRRSGYVTLDFAYEYAEPGGPAQIRVCAREVPGCSESFSLQLRELDKIDLPALCATLAAQIRDHQGARLPAPSRRRRRREED